MCSRTGIIYNVTKSSVGVIVHKVVGNRYIEKRVNVRVEHIRHSKCRQEFLDRVKSNAQKKKEAKAAGGKFFFFWWLNWIISDLLYLSHFQPQETPRSTPRCSPCLYQEQRSSNYCSYSLWNSHLKNIQ